MSSYSSSRILLDVTFGNGHLSDIDEMNDVQVMTLRWDDRAWWVVVFLHSPNKGFWAFLGDLPLDMPSHQNTAPLSSGGIVP